jgi:apolipoprotein N-acyltransferase
VARTSWRTPAAGAFSGVLLALCFPPIGWTGLLPVALLPWFAALRVEERRVFGAISGFLMGLPFWVISISWVSHVMTHFGGLPPAVGAGVLVLLAALLSIGPALLGFAAVGGAAPRSATRVALLPILWVASEHLRAHLFSGFPWNLLAYPLALHPIWIQTASLWGAYGVSGLVALTTVLLMTAVRPGTRPAPRSAASVGLLLLLGATAVFGRARLLGHRHEIPSFAIAAVQPNIPQALRWSPEKAAEIYTAVLAQTRAAAARRPDLIVLPESALPVTWQRSARLRADLREVASACDCAILFNDVDEEPDGRYYNAARVVGPDGAASLPYRKVHLVPFGEYVPLKSLFSFARSLTREVGGFSAGSKPTLLRARGIPIGPAVCYEVVYPSLMRRETRLGAQLLVTITNDAWYGRAGAQKQHFAAALFRAVENGRPMARAAITGISGIVDSKGRVLAIGPENTRRILYAAVTPRVERTLWTAWGYGFVILADVAGIIVLLFSLVRPFRRAAQP